MTTVRELHDKAMDLADEAISAQRRGDRQRALRLNRDALQHEREAAIMVADIPNSEPTRSVLLRSAATLALECGEIREAERLVAIALAGDPPHEIAEELRDVLEQVYFSRHMEVRGVELSQDEVQLALAGGSISLGFGRAEYVLPRIDMFEKAFYRTAERKCGAEYSEHGSRQVRDNFEVEISVPRAASFAVSFRVAQRQATLFDNAPPAQILEELLMCLSIYNSEDEERLKRIIGNDSYYKNFVGLARRMKPDGREVKLVGFTALLSTGYEQEASLTRANNRISLSQRSASDDVALMKPGATRTEPISVTGRLKLASITGRDRIQIVDEHKKKHTIIVPKGMMTDIVRPMWDTMVTVVGEKRGKLIYLEDIRSA
ncbi:hypothetical protein [Sorangium sp. So ce128]|uniref:hypothetical protein n=1 Tax=Sorangium sp. So ce128 TaxID=3133281 RepID=UPI003F5F2616